jgi:transaldolase
VKIFLDTANVAHIREAASWGILDGVTTNPSLVAKEGRKFREVLDDICRIVNGPISAEVVSVKAEEMIREGRQLAKIHDNIVVKVPLIVEGLKAVKVLAGEGIPCNVTLCFSAGQALLAAKAGAAYISPFIGRLDDIGVEGMDLIREIKAIYANFGYKTQILAASCRTPNHVRDAAVAGADVATIPFDVLQKMIKHPLTDAGLKAFLDDWEKAREKVGSAV